MLDISNISMVLYIVLYYCGPCASLCYIYRAALFLLDLVVVLNCLEIFNFSDFFSYWVGGLIYEIPQR